MDILYRYTNSLVGYVGSLYQDKPIIGGWRSFILYYNNEGHSVLLGAWVFTGSFEFNYVERYIKFNGWRSVVDDDCRRKIMIDNIEVDPKNIILKSRLVTSGCSFEQVKNNPSISGYFYTSDDDELAKQLIPDRIMFIVGDKGEVNVESPIEVGNFRHREDLWDGCETIFTDFFLT